MRLRKQGKKAFLTYKGKADKKEAHIREEHETEVLDFDTTDKILQALGMKEWLSLKKKRTSYRIKDSMVEIDTMLEKYSFIPTFMEIESASVQKIHEIAKMLGFRKEDCKTWGFKKLAKNYDKQVKI